MTVVDTAVVDDGLPGSGGDAAVIPADPSNPKEYVERLGLSIDNVVTATSASEIAGDSNTLYLVDGTINGGRWFESIDDVAIMGKPGADATVRTDHRDYDFLVEDSANGFVIGNITADQRPDGGWFRVNAGGNSVHIHNIETLGSGRPANPQPNSPSPGGNGGPTYFIPARSSGAVNTFVNVDLTHHGVFPKIHWGNRPIGLWSGGGHKGTTRVVDSVFEGIPNNPIYGTASPGRYEVIGCQFRDNGVTVGGRFSHGYWRNCDISFDFHRANLQYDAQPNHGVVGCAAEQKKQGVTGDSGPDVINTNIHMVNVGKGGAGIRAYDIYRPSKLGRIEDTEVHIEKGTGGWDADIEIEGPVEKIVDTVFSGSNDEYYSIVNTSGQRVVMDNCKWDYPAPRERDKGDVVWR